MFVELSERAESDPIAARVLAQQLRICDETPRTRSELDDLLAIIRRDAELAGVGDNSQSYVFESAEQAKFFEVQTIGDSELCSSVTRTMIDRSKEFFQIAADQGDFIATVSLDGIARAQGDWEKVHQTSWRLWNEHGSPYSLGNLAHIFANDLVGNIQLNEIPNTVSAHALNLISTEFQFLFMSERIPAEQVNLRVEYDDILNRTASLLSPAEHTQAEELALKLIADNENCCQRF